MDNQIVKVESSDKVSDETVTQTETKTETETQIETDTKSSAPLLLEYLKVSNGYSSHYDRVTNNKPLTDKELEIYKINYNIFNILSGAAMKEAEKVSCRSGCKGAQQVYYDTLTKMLEPVNKQNEEANNCQNSVE